MADKKIDDISDLMRMSGLSRNSINKLYKETKIDTTKLETLFKLCDTFGCQLSDLIEYTPDSKA
jgi:putative transcriptional regulator